MKTWMRALSALALSAAAVACGNKEVAIEQEPATPEQAEMGQRLQQMMQQQQQVNQNALQKQMQSQPGQTAQ